jgi:hypothetical protein
MTRILTLAALLLPAASLAYETNDFPWNESHVTFRVLTGMPSAFKDVMEEVESQYDANPTSHKTSVIWDDENGWGIPNSESEVGWITNLSSVCPNAGGGCAKTWVVFDPFDAYLAEADLVFDAYQDWTTTKDKADHWNYGGDGRPFLCTALHEMGHALGLQHENDRYNIMGDDTTMITTNDSTFQCEIGADGMAGLASMYGVQTPRIDFGVSHWRYLGAGGNGNAYSMHGRARMLSGTNWPGLGMVYTELPKNSDGAYNITAGTTVYAEFSLQNAGTLFAAVPVSIMLSDNALITSLDNELQSSVQALNAGAVTTLRLPVVIPSTWIRPEPWFIGVHADKNAMHAEARESNNRTYIALVNVQ